jgi:hypothetical protein
MKFAIASGFEALDAGQNQMEHLLSTNIKPMIGLEPTTLCLQSRCSTIELHRRINSLPGSEPFQENLWRG